MIKYVAIQSLRTPSYYSRVVETADRIFEPAIKKVMDNALGIASQDPQQLRRKISETKNSIDKDSNQFNLTAEVIDIDGNPHYKIEGIVGREEWISHMKRMMKDHIDRLLKHRWTIIEAHPQHLFFTSDNPVILLNWKSESQYNFHGAWDKKNANIIMPLTPHKMIFTEIGKKGKTVGFDKDIWFSKQMNKLTCENAHICVFAKAKQRNIETYFKRVIDSELYNQYQHAMNNWHNHQKSVLGF